MDRITQIECVRAYLENNGSLTSLEAFKRWHITRLSSIIYRLRKRGYNISTIMKTSDEGGYSSTYAIYKLIKD